MTKITSIDHCILHEMPRIQTADGSLSFVQDFDQVPFELKRVYYLYDVPGGEDRGGHAHHQLQQYIIAASGSFEVVLRDGKNEKTVFLNRPYCALEIVPGIWRELKNFSSGSICLVLASHEYDEVDYIRNYSQFLSFKEISK